MAAGALFDINHFFPYYVSAVILLERAFIVIFKSK